MYYRINNIFNRFILNNLSLTILFKCIQSNYDHMGPLTSLTLRVDVSVIKQRVHQDD